MSICKGCGSPTKNCGDPIWEDVCTNKDCTYDADQFKLQVREHCERMRKGKALRDAAPELYEALELIETYAMVQVDRYPDAQDNKGWRKIIAALSKARGEKND